MVSTTRCSVGSHVAPSASGAACLGCASVPAMRRPVIGYSILLDDPLLKHVEQRLREPLQRYGALLIGLPRNTPLEDVDGAARPGRRRAALRRLRHRPGALRPRAARADEDRRRAAGRARRGRDRAGPRRPCSAGCRSWASAAATRCWRWPTAARSRRTCTRCTPARTRTPTSGRDLALEPPGEHWHEVVAEPGSAAARWLAGGPQRVNSFHHQCVATTGGVLRPTVRTRDGVIEATGAAGRPRLGGRPAVAQRDDVAARRALPGAAPRARRRRARLRRPARGRGRLSAA